MNDAGRVGFVIRGDYSATETYDFLDVVYYNGSSYVAKKLTTGNTPQASDDYWQVIANANSADISDETPIFTESTTRTNINSGEKISTLFGKIKKWFTDLKAVAFSGSYNDLSDKPSIPAAVAVKGNAESSYRTGNVNLTPANLGLGNVNNTSDANKPVSTAQQTALDKKLDKTGDSKDNTITFTSADSTTATAWTDVAVLSTGEKHSSIFNKVSTMFKNIRFLYKMLGTTDISAIGDGTVTNALSTLNSNLTTTKNSLKNYYNLSNVDIIEIKAETDLNSLTEAGTYRCSSSTNVSTLKNCPISSGNFKLTVDKIFSTAFKQTIAYISGSTQTYTRFYGNGKFTNWICSNNDDTKSYGILTLVTADTTDYSYIINIGDIIGILKIACVCPAIEAWGETILFTSSIKPKNAMSFIVVDDTANNVVLDGEIDKTGQIKIYTRANSYAGGFIRGCCSFI